MVPFMNTSIVAGPVAAALHGTDLAFYVGFIVTGALYYALRNAAGPRSGPGPVTGPGGQAEGQ